MKRGMSNTPGGEEFAMEEDMPLATTRLPLSAAVRREARPQRQKVSLGQPNYREFCST